MTLLRQWVPSHDVVKLGGRSLPGVARVTVTMPDCIDRQKPRGRKKCKTRDDGDKPAEIEIELELTPGQHVALKPFVPMLRPRGKSEPRNPLAIVHPKCAFWGIDVVTIGQIQDPAPIGGGSVVVMIRAFEWTPEATEVAKPQEKPQDGTEQGDGWDIPLQRLPPSQNPDSAATF